MYAFNFLTQNLSAFQLTFSYPVLQSLETDVEILCFPVRV